MLFLFVCLLPFYQSCSSSSCRQHFAGIADISLLVQAPLFVHLICIYLSPAEGAFCSLRPPLALFPKPAAEEGFHLWCLRKRGGRGGRKKERNPRTKQQQTANSPGRGRGGGVKTNKQGNLRILFPSGMGTICVKQPLAMINVSLGRG